MILTDEQTSAIKSFTEEKLNVSVQAVPGAGKSTLIIELIKVLRNKGAKCLVVSYNTDLAAHMVKLLTDNNLDDCAVCYTFHSLCSNFIQLAPDDISFEIALNYCDCGYIEPKKINATHVLVDEVQDMKDIYIKLLKHVLEFEPLYFICGDLKQMLYDFDPDSMANTEILVHPDKYFNNEVLWSHKTCSITHRLPKNVTTFVNTIFRTNIVSNKETNEKINVISPNPWKMGDALLPYLKGEISSILLLTATKNGNRPLKALINFFSNKGIPIHMGTNSEKSDERIKNEKLNVVTFHSSKGTEAENVIVLVSEEEKENPLYVALTRTFKSLTIVIDPKKPNLEISKACIMVPELVNASSDTLKIMRECSTKEKVIKSDKRGIAPQRSLQRARPRISLYSHFTYTKEQPKREEITKTFTVSTNNNRYEDTSKVYAQAVYMYVEYFRTNKIKYMEDLLHPTRIEYDQQAKVIEMGMNNRFVFPSIPSSALLPEDLYSKAEMSYFSAKNAIDFCTMALATLSWDDFHYVMRQLLPVENWVDQPFFQKMCETALELVPDDETSIYDVRLKHKNSDAQVLHLRAHIYNKNYVVHLVWSNETSQADRGDAALRAAMHHKKTCKLINILSGEVEIIKTDNAENVISSI